MLGLGRSHRARVTVSFNITTGTLLTVKVIVADWVLQVLRWGFECRKVY